MAKTNTPKNNPTPAALVDGLTVEQTTAAKMIAAGESITAVAVKINVSRGTLYRWAETPPFYCYVNQIRQDARQLAENSLFSLVGDAVETLRNCLQSPNDTTRLNAAKYILERVGNIPAGDTNPVAVIRQQHTTDTNDLGWNQIVDDEAVQRDLQRYGLNLN